MDHPETVGLTWLSRNRQQAWPDLTCLLTPTLPLLRQPSSSVLNQTPVLPKTPWVSVFPPALSPLSCYTSKPKVQAFRRFRLTQLASPPCPGGWRPWDCCAIFSSGRVTMISRGWLACASCAEALRWKFSPTILSPVTHSLRRKTPISPPPTKAHYGVLNTLFFGGRNQDCYLPRSFQPVHLSLAIERIRKTRLFKCCHVLIPRAAVISSSFDKIPSWLREVLPCMRLKVCQTHQGHFWTFKGKTKTNQTNPSEKSSDIWGGWRDRGGL